mgnify:CR=1 FL=1
MSVTVLTIERSLSDLAIQFKINGLTPSKVRPREPTDACMKISTFASIEVSPIVKEVPLYRAHEAALGLLEVDVCELVPGVSDKRAAETLLNVLEICSSSEVTKT